MVALALLGQESEAQQTKARLLQEHPGFDLKFAQQKLFYVKRADQLARYFRGLQQAGIS